MYMVLKWADTNTCDISLYQNLKLQNQLAPGRHCTQSLPSVHVRAQSHETFFIGAMMGKLCRQEVIVYDLGLIVVTGLGELQTHIQSVSPHYSKAARPCYY